MHHSGSYASVITKNAFQKWEKYHRRNVQREKPFKSSLIFYEVNAAASNTCV